MLCLLGIAPNGLLSSRVTNSNRLITKDLAAGYKEKMVLHKIFYLIDSDRGRGLDPIVGAGTTKSHKSVGAFGRYFGDFEACLMTRIEIRVERLDGTAISSVVHLDLGIAQATDR